MSPIKTPKVLVIDDEIGIQESLKMILKEDYDVLTAPNSDEAFKVLDEKGADLILLDVLLPGMDGIEILKKVRSLKPEMQVIMVTGQDKVRIAVEAMKLGAFDYIHKPFDIDELRNIVKRALENSIFYDELEQLRNQIKESHRFGNMIGAAPGMQDIFQTITRVMNSNSNILITGESGTGKELVARALHYHGNRKEGPFVVVQTSSIPEKLLESELFGHEKGAFTGAIQRKKGTVELAHGGTLFLDEIGDMPMEMQAKLLRLLQEREFRRVGGTETIKVEVRFVAATNKFLEKAVQDGKFREDLYYRLNVVPMVLPPLRERKEDIPLLVYHLLERYRSTTNSTIENLSPEAMEVLQNYEWPGNVRELQNVIENMAVMVSKPLIQIEDLPTQIRVNQLQKSVLERQSKGGVNLEEIVATFEKQLIEEALRKCNGIFTRAARLLGTTRRILKYRIDKLNLQVERRHGRPRKSLGEVSGSVV